MGIRLACQPRSNHDWEALEDRLPIFHHRGNYDNDTDRGLDADWYVVKRTVVPSHRIF